MKLLATAIAVFKECVETSTNQSLIYFLYKTQEETLQRMRVELDGPLITTQWTTSTNVFEYFQLIDEYMQSKYM